MKSEELRVKSEELADAALKSRNSSLRSSVSRSSLFTLFTLIFTLHSSLLALSARQPDTLPTIFYADGVRLATEEKYAEALEKFAKVLALEPAHDPSLYETANVLTMLGDPAKALEYSSRAAAIDPSNIWYRGQKARLLVALEHFDEALPLFESMLHMGRGFEPDNYRVLALLYYDKGRVDDAVAVLDTLDMRMGLSPEVADLKRHMLISAERMDDAIAVTEEYVAQVPYDEPGRILLSEIYAYKGRDSLQVAMLKEVLDINPDNVDALLHLADYYSGHGQLPLFFATIKQFYLLDEVPLEDKLDNFAKLIGDKNLYRQYYHEINDLALVLVTHYPGEASVIEAYSAHLIRGGNIEGALGILKTGLEKPDAPLSTFLQTIEFETYLGHPDSVALYSDRALARYHGEMDIYIMKSGALQYMKRYREARGVLKRALKIAGTDSVKSVIYGSIGTVWHEEGKSKKTFSNYERALRYDSNNVLVLNNYAYFLAVAGRELDRAMDMASRAVKSEENSATYLDTYAWVLYKLGNYTEAREVMKRALPLDGTKSPELLIHYGDILWALGDRFMATRYWRQAREAGYEPVSDIEERLSRGGD